MNKEQKINSKQKVFESKDTKKTFQKGLKYLALALPLLFASPVIVTMGFKAISRGNGYFLLILGCLLTVVTIGLVTQAFRLILKSLFEK